MVQWELFLLWSGHVLICLATKKNLVQFVFHLFLFEFFYFNVYKLVKVSRSVLNKNIFEVRLHHGVEHFCCSTSANDPTTLLGPS